MQQSMGVGKVNEALQVMTIDGVYGPIAIGAESLGTTSLALMCAKEGALATPLVTDQDTAVTAEATGYTGNTVLLAFTGQSLNNVPILPKSVEVKPTAGGDTVNCKDLNGDGILYTSDVDLDACGYVDYFTGAIRLNFPAGKAPNTGAITCDYKYSVAIVGRGMQMFRINNVRPGERIRVYAVAQTTPAQIQVDVMDLNQ